MKKRKWMISLIIVIILWSFIWIKVDSSVKEESTLDTMIGIIKMNFSLKGYVEISEHTYLVREKKIEAFITSYEEEHDMNFIEQAGSGYIFEKDQEKRTLSSYKISRRLVIFKE